MNPPQAHLHHPSTALALGIMPGVALSYLLGIISIMNRITISPFALVSGRCSNL